MLMSQPYPVHHAVANGHISRCQICNSDDLHTILDLGSQPPCDAMLPKEKLDEPETAYPLRMVWCASCTGVQIDYCVNGAEIYFPNYPYKSGVTKELVEYQSKIAHDLIEKFGLQAGDLVVDVGSNDGTLLAGFADTGIKTVGVEPTNVGQYARDRGIETIQAFFDIKTAEAIREKHGAASVVVTTNTFAHMQTLGEFIMGAHTLLKDGGVFVSETHYLLDVIQGGQFDTIYHEHLRTYSLTSLSRLFEQYDFTLTDVERGDRYGGNIRVYVTKGKGHTVSPRVAELLKVEEDAGLGKLETYQAFAERVRKARLEFMTFLLETKNAGTSIVGKSCPGRCATLLNYYGVDSELIPYLAEQPASLKMGLYLPGKHIAVVDEDRLFKEQPAYVVIMAWHYAKPIMQQLKARGLKSDFVIPLPDFKIVRNSEV